MLHTNKFILCALMTCLIIVGCSSDDLSMDTTVKPSTESKVMARMTRATVDSFAQAGITNVRVFAYIRQGKRDSLVKDTTVNIGDGQFQIGLPLGESIRTFLVANATGIENTEKFDSVSLTLDPSQDADIWLSNVASITTDKTVSSIDFTMQRIISRATFQPEETLSDIEALGKFDNLDVTFTNIAARYRISGDSAVALTTYSANANADNSYTLTVNSFPTRTGIDATAGLTLKFNNGQQTVNTTPADIDAAFNYTGSHHYYITVPLTDDAFVVTPWTRARLETIVPFRIQDFLF